MRTSRTSGTMRTSRTSGTMRTMRTSRTSGIMRTMRTSGTMRTMRMMYRMGSLKDVQPYSPYNTHTANHFHFLDTLYMSHLPKFYKKRNRKMEMEWTEWKWRK